MVQSAMTITISRVILFLGGQHRNIQNQECQTRPRARICQAIKTDHVVCWTDFPASVGDNPCKSSGSNGIAQQESPLLTWQTKNQTDFWDRSTIFCNLMLWHRLSVTSPKFWETRKLRPSTTPAHKGPEAIPILKYLQAVHVNCYCLMETEGMRVIHSMHHEVSQEHMDGATKSM